MRPKSFMLLIMALGCGLVASIGISQVIENRGPNEAEETVEIYVAMTDIGTGDPVTAQMIKLEAWPKSKVDGLLGVITNSEDLLDRRPRTTIFAGEPVLLQKLADGMASATERIREGFRAVAVKVDSVTSLGGVLQPGDRVDVQVYLKRDPANGIDAAGVRTLLQNVKVFAVNDLLDRSEEEGNQSITARTITLELTPQQSELVTLATKIGGGIQLVGRNATDLEDKKTEGVSILDIIGTKSASKDEEEKTPAESISLVEQAKQAVAAAMAKAQPVASDPMPKDTHEMEILRGGDVAVAVFEGGKFVMEQAAGGGGASSDDSALPTFDDDTPPNGPTVENDESAPEGERAIDRPE
jgi:pilus assembly protein CpaB